MSKPRVIIADDHVLLAEAFEKLLSPECDIVAKVTDGRALVEAVRTLHPDIVLIDIAMPLLNGLDASRQIRAIDASIKIVFLTMNGDPAMVAEAFRRGASGYLPKTAAAAELPVATRAVLQGKRYVSPLIAPDFFDLKTEYEGTTGAPGQLTTRQKQVVQLLAEGRSMKEVAEVLNVATRTVAFHKYRIMKVLHLRNGAELVQYAMKEHMLSS